MTLNQLFVALKGGHTSGNFGHEGRPGKLGGSGPGGGFGKIGITSAPGADRNFDVHMYRLDKKVGKPLEKEPEEEKDFQFVPPNELNDHYKTEELCRRHPPECDSLRNYCSGDYEAINTHLRKGYSGGRSIPEQIEAIDSIIDQAPRVPQDMKVLRGIHGEDVFAKLEQGTVFEDKGFVSTTVGYNEVATREGKGHYMLEIQVPKGSKGIYVQRISEFPEEEELLLPRGSRFNVISKGTTKAVLELING